MQAGAFLPAPATHKVREGRPCSGRSYILWRQHNFAELSALTNRSVSIRSLFER